MSREIYIYHHLGLGDHFICNGMVREISKNSDKINIFCKNHNKVTVSNIYKDDERFEVLSFYNDVDVERYISQNKLENVYRIGFEDLRRRWQGSKTFDMCFYEQFNIPFDYRWSMFKINRDIEKEKILLEKYNLKIDDEYCFIHDDLLRGFNIDYDRVETNIRIIRPDISFTENMLDYSLLLENATEIHCMDSSFRILADSLLLKSDELYYHTYVRGIENVCKSKHDWKILV